MIKMFFDIETLPSPEDAKEIHVDILRKKMKDKTDEEIHVSTSFEGTFGRICCIGIIKEDERGLIQKDVFAGSEKEILTNFWKAAEGVHRYVGHNIWAFDLPFIYKRSIINGVKPIALNFARYRNIPIYDTMMEWELWNMMKAQKLDTLAKILGLPTSKDEMDGSMVADYFKAGRIEEIKKYCMKDVELTRKVYYKMTFEEMPS
ncbi:MAG TPA: ribonuclease H-like domain-containing protein, partial [Patescibacteria group bacterium]